MRTQAFKFLDYLETAGGPVCICPINVLPDWTGAEEESGLYWHAIDEIGVEPLEIFREKFILFNSETGNFALFRTDKQIVIAEIITIEPFFSMPWNGIEFEIDELELVIPQLNGLIAIFDAGLTLGSVVHEECVRAVNGSQVWNAAFLEGNFSSSKQVTYKSDSIYLTGVLLTK